MTSTERSHRHRAKLRAERPATTKQATKPDDAALSKAHAHIRALKEGWDLHASAATARIRELEAEVARLRAELATKQTRIRELEAEVTRYRQSGAAIEQMIAEHRRSGGTAARRSIDAKDESTLMKLIRRLDSPGKEVEAAVRALGNELKARGRGFQELGDLTSAWDAEDAARQPKKLKPIDWDAVKSAVDQYVDGKTKVNIYQIFRKAIWAKVPALNEQRSELGKQAQEFVERHLRSLGFTIRSHSTAERKAAKQA
jgi:chromosome segregation ATPase